MNSTLQQQFDRYSESHQNKINQTIHAIAVPLIYISVLGFFWAIPTPAELSRSLTFNFAWLAIIIMTGFYVRRSFSLGLGIVILSLISLGLFQQLEQQQYSVAIISLIIFIVAWVAQFIGHGYEGKKPSFIEDLQFLLVGPGWVIAKLYRRLHIPL